MDTSSFSTSVLHSNGHSAWNTLAAAQLADGTPLTLLFNNLLVSYDNTELFAIGYSSTSESLANKSIRFYLLRWDLTNTETSMPFYS
jgi:hypothetical protein